MKSNVVKLLAFLWCFAATAADITFNLADFTATPLAVQRLSIYPLYTPNVSGSSVITSDRLTYKTDGTGTVIVTNMIPGTYRCEFLGPYGTTTFYVITPSTNANAVDLITAATNSVSGFTSYTTTQSDSRYLLKTNGSAYGFRIPTGAISNYVWTCTNATTGAGEWRVANGSGTVTSVAVTSSNLTVTGSPVTGAGTINVSIPTSYTNGLASQGYVNAATNGFVYASVTNGLASTGYVQTATNGFLRTNEIQAGTNIVVTYSNGLPVINSTASGGGGGSASLYDGIALTNPVIYSQQFSVPSTVFDVGTNLFINFATSSQTLALTNANNVTLNFWSTNRTVIGSYSNGICTVMLRLLSPANAQYTLNMPTSWRFIGSLKPTNLATNKAAILSLTLWGTNETDVTAAYAVEP